ncbi:hypothetical protein ALO40_200115 [Pseudomonas syringae pv. viburni]|uniref:Uncharacterized protein n=1 Tax=Pseudomonas syringae pv. viburni TaxID=251703 RepID=A0A0Q0DDG1_9PSED|nr:hypothetical protein ALO40_200115 [Pseudomonas syringae pv. viburni]
MAMRDGRTRSGWLAHMASGWSSKLISIKLL